MLSFLLFAGAIHVNIRELAQEKKAVFLFATIGVVLSTIIVGTLLMYTSYALGVDFPPLYYYLFGASNLPNRPNSRTSHFEKSWSRQENGNEN